MCGRYVITSAPEALRRLFGYAEIPNFPPRYNVAPTQPVPVVLQEQGVRHFHLMRWGLLPAWVKDPRKFALVINARTETVRDKPAFRNALQRRRCLLPADGYYEWQERAGRKVPFFIHPRARGPMAFAGLAETWTGPNGEELDTVAILTAAAPPLMAALHNRVPVTIAPADFVRWLDCMSFDAEAAMALAVPPPPGAFAWHEVSTEVNRVANDDPQLILPVAADDVPPSPPPRPKKPARPKPADDDAQGSLF
jgi:putative SOS response-associated peptidase YedK